MKKKEEDGKERFELFYSNIYKERWSALKEALLKEKESLIAIPSLRSPYYLDIASYYVASLLPIEEGMDVLDMCAAPGGKTLVIASKLNGKGSLISNDRSPDRRERLKRSINECLDEDKSRIVKITGYDANRFGLYNKECYDAILLDAPCSSERHVLTSEKHLKQWSPSRPKRLAIEQYSLLSAALLSIRKGGCILYSTCSINPNENQEVIKRLDKKHHAEIDLIDFELEGSEKMEYGRIIMPDIANGRGPMFAALIRKKDE